VKLASSSPLFNLFCINHL